MFDITVIGGGPAGVTAALHASELGASVALVERARMGGTCTNDGCVPTRVLARAARLARDAEQFDHYGLSAPLPSVDFARLISRTQQVVYQIQEKKQLIKHLEESGVTVFHGIGSASFVDPHHIQIGETQQIETEKVILCAGGHARRLGFPGAEFALTHSDVWSIKTLPASVAIVGAAATGCQLGSIFAAFGVEVTLLDLAPNILPVEDESTCQVMQQAFIERGIKIITSIGSVTRIEKMEPGYRLHYTRDDQALSLDAGAVILSVGWPASLESLNLQAASVASEHGYVKVDDTLRTTAPNVFAAGDITGRMMLVQSASYEARVAAENAVMNTSQSHIHQIVPHGGFTDPEYGSVGLTEAQARKHGECITAIVPYQDMDRAVIDGYTDGFCKLIVEPQTQQILGAHVVGEQALEIVHLVAAGMAAKMPISTLANLEIAYPTYTAVVGLAARKITRELGGAPLAAQWRTLSRLPLPEWERRDPLT